MTLRRGFKAEAERIALEVRSDLGLHAADPLDVFALAEHLAIPAIPISRIPVADSSNDFVEVFRTVEPDSFSALTLFQGTRRVIVYNDAHHRNRQASDLAHEVAHCLLEHQPAALIDGAGCRYWQADVEGEADWLAGALLIPRDGGLHFARRDQSVQEIAEHFGVSEQLCRWRLHQTGILRQVERLARFR